MKSLKINSLILATIAIYIATFKAEGLADDVKNSIQIIMLSIVLVYFVCFRKKFQFNNVSIILIFPIILSSVIAYFNKIISALNLINCMFYMICLMFFYQIIYIWIKSNKYFEMISILQITTFFYCILSIISVLKIGTDKSATTIYLFGGKFTTCYYFLFFLGLTFAKYQNKIKKYMVWQLKFFCLCIITVSIELYMKCITAVLITILLSILSMMTEKIKKILTQKKALLLGVFASGLILFVISSILSNKIVQNIIVHYLGKSVTLTDRTPIYSTYLFPLILKRPIWGYGFSSSILHLTTPYWNAQNGLFEIMLNYGCFGCLSFLLIIWLSAGNENKNTFGWPYYIVIYALVLAGTIEISFSFIFYITIFILYQTKNIKNCDRNKGNYINE